MCPVAGSQETSSEVVGMRGTNVLGADPAFSLRHRNNISAIRGSESQAETPNTSFTAKWNGHVFLGLWGEATGSHPSLELKDGALFCPVEKRIPFPAAI